MSGLRRWLIPVVGVLGTVGAGLLIVGARVEAGIPASFPEVDLEELDMAAPWVRVVGTAHYDSLITQTVPDSLLASGGTWYLFAFFPENDTAGRQIPLLVRTQRPPERLVSFETMTIEGRLVPMTKDKVPPQTETILSKRTDYFFSDEVKLVVPVRVIAEDEVWDEPR